MDRQDVRVVVACRPARQEHSIRPGDTSGVLETYPPAMPREPCPTWPASGEVQQPSTATPVALAAK